jgi:predicted nucleotidyltransferase
MERAGKELELLVLFGSVARGEHLPESDVDICVVGGDLRRFRYDFFPVRFEVHEKTREEFCGMEDSVVLDCLMQGMPLKGEEMVYALLKGLSSFPKSYLIHRLNQARRFLEMGEKAKEGAARDYFTHLARINLAESAGILRKGKAASLRKAGEPGLTEEAFLELHEELGRRGDRIWLTGST